MHLCRHYQSFPAHLHGCVVAIGNFDGVHRGHQHILSKARSIARALNVPCVAMTFTPHPRAFFAKQSGKHVPLAIDPLAIRLRRLKAEGVDGILLQRFDAPFAALCADSFVRDVLIHSLHAQHIVIGDDFCFGARRSGTATTMAHLAAEHGADVTTMPPLLHEDIPISSSRIRKALNAGDMNNATALLGRPYQCYGRIQHGHKRGRTIGIPTANIALDGLYLPKYGVYAVEYAIIQRANCATHPPDWQHGIANLGIRPSFDDGDIPTLEVHAFSTLGDMYGHMLRARLIHFIRPEQRFDDKAALGVQITHDIAQAKAVLAARAA